MNEILPHKSNEKSFVGLPKKVGAYQFDHFAERHKLTPRETDVARLMCEGFSNKVIGEKLFVTDRAVKFHNTNIYRKVGVRSRTELICAAMNYIAV